MKKLLLTDKHVLPILTVLVVCTFPHFFNISMWTIFCCLLMWMYTYGVARYSWQLPGRAVKLLLVTIFFLLAMTTNEGFTIEAFVSLLSLMICMKLLDSRNKKNRMTTVILCYFLIVGSLFFDDSMYATAYMFFSVLCTTAVLMYTNQPDRRPTRYLKLTGKLMIQAFPIMVLLFLVFPRIHGGMWAPVPKHSAKPGFSDHLTFGDIAKMAKNTDVAFRVEFDEGKIPLRDQLYWRGLVLWEFDGQTWHRGVHRRGSSARRTAASDKIKYTLTLEPHNEQWLMTLDLPMRISLRRSWLLGDFSYFRWRPISQRISYQGESFLDANDIVQNSFDKDGLELPKRINPRTRALAESLFANEGNIQGYVNRVLNYFSEQPFAYTLNPPPLSPGNNTNGSDVAGNLIDSFLFETRKGFCEHYATAFTFLMRAAGVPTRIVVGYLGGSLNKYGGYLVVRQSQAHAWCEVWLEGRGWVRIDPTAAVAPSRISGDVDDAVPESENIGLAQYFRGTFFESWLEPMTNTLDLINSRWNKWVMGYTTFEQADLFSRFGIDLSRGAGPVKAFITALVVLSSAALALSFILLRQKRVLQNQLTLAWQEFCVKLAKIGLPRKPSQGPVDYMGYVIRKRPDLKTQVRAIVLLYVKQRYGGEAEDKESEKLRSLVKQFTPRSSGA